MGLGKLLPAVLITGAAGGALISRAEQASAPGLATVAETQHVDPELERVRRLLAETPLVDGHNDLPWAIRTHAVARGDLAAYGFRDGAPGHTDLPRLREGMVGAQFWSVYVGCEEIPFGAARVQLEQIDLARRLIEAHPGELELALSAADVERIFAEGRIASLLGMEGGHTLENSLGTLRAYYDLGVRYMSLTHNCSTAWADAAAGVARHGGLTEFGREVVREMNRLGMLVDLSHVSPEVMRDVLDVTEAPVIFSHSSARAVTDHVRNVPDDILRRMPENGGVVMVTFVPEFVSEAVRTHQGVGPAPRATTADVIEHIEHVRRVAGPDHVGLGSDFDGTDYVVQGLEDVSTYPALLTALARRGWSDVDLRKLAGQNVLRVMREAEAVAARLQRERPASTATIWELDRR